MVRLFYVGEYTEAFNAATGQCLPCGPIYESVGLLTHIQKRHPTEVENVPLIPSVIAAPDYIGHNPREPNSIELVKVFQSNMMVCIKLDVAKNYLYVASAFTISGAKLRNRLNSGRLKKY